MASLETELTFLTPETRLAILVPTRVDARAHVRGIQRKIGTDRPPVVLYNLRAWQTFTHVQAIYLQQLKKYQDLGLRVVIILYDELVSKLSGVSSDDIDMQEVILDLRKWIYACKLKPESTEIFLESEIWKLFPEDILDRLTSFAHSLEASQNATVVSVSISTVLDGLCELVYETLLEADFVLTGGQDINDIWSQMRLDSLNKLGYHPPCVVSFPLIVRPDSTAANTRVDDLSVFSDPDIIKQAVSTATDEFIKQIFELFLIPQSKSSSLVIDRKSINSYVAAQNLQVPDDELRRFAGDALAKYFVDLKNASSD